MKYTFKFHCDSINIPEFKDVIGIASKFKFHCDSINIYAGIEEVLQQLEFKFHCDSINIQIKTYNLTQYDYLNSTVILLIFFVDENS